MTDIDRRTEIERKLEAESAQRSESSSAVETIESPQSGTPSQPWPSQQHQTPPVTQPKQGILAKWKDGGGLLGGIATFLILVFKFLAPAIALLGKLKFVLFALKGILITSASMVVSAFAYSTRYGWAFGIGLVLLIFIHECGHAVAGIMKGMKPGLMLFIPFMGAFVTIGEGKSLEEDAFIGIMGPVFGTLACIGCSVLFFTTGNPLFAGLAYFGYFMNLFNLAPTVPLDGGWIVPLFSPKLLAFGVVILVLFGFRNPMIWVLGVLSIPRIISGWKADPKTQPYYQVSTKTKVAYGFAYAGLAGFLAIAMMLSHDMMSGIMSR
ncbi:MAG TPA: site-2 protease family protein [Capsulimonadaceae bacterium]|jgi:Zn-dependent protease